MTSDNTQSLKKQMRIALVGIRPADQITLKGYLRVLLRLDVELVWVSATEGDIHLFMVNSEFRSASSVAKLLEINRGASVLYVNRTESGEGGIQQDLLTLPLRQINLLNDWLVRRVSVLSGLAYQINKHTAELQEKSVQNPTPVQPQTQATLTLMDAHEDLSGLVNLIQTIQQRQQSCFELVDGNNIVAIVDAKRQIAWVQDTSYRLTSALSARLFYGQTPDKRDAIDASQWLWQLAWKSSDVLLPLIDNTSKHYIRFWIKPPKESRRDLLQIMTALEANTVSVVEIAGKAGVSILLAKKMVAALLFSGNLSKDSYERLSTRLTHLSSQPTHNTHELTPAMNTAPVQEVSVQNEVVIEEQKTEKMGFLARLRRKLGL